MAKRRQRQEPSPQGDLPSLFADMTTKDANALLEHARRWIDQQWESWIKELETRDPDLAAKARAVANDYLLQQEREVRDRRRQAHETIAGWRQKLARGHAEGRLSAEDYERALGEVDKEARKWPAPKAPVELIGTGLRKVQLAWNLLDEQAKNAWLKRILERVVIGGKTATPEPKFELALLIAVAEKQAEQEAERQAQAQAAESE